MLVQDANTKAQMLLASCGTAADRPVILAFTNNGGNVCDFTVSTPNGGMYLWSGKILMALVMLR